MHAIEDKLRVAREASWSRFGKQITFYVPGSIRRSGLAGRYQAISITGDQCELNCDHCQGKLLESMDQSTTAEELVSRCIDYKKKGHLGVLISGGCNSEGQLPWKNFIPAIRKIKQETGLYISVHSGIIDYGIAKDLKSAGVDQALFDVIGDDDTYRKVCHAPFGISHITSSMAAMQDAGLPMVPHIVCGLFGGEIGSEMEAVKIISMFRVSQIVIVSLMKLSAISNQKIRLPAASDVAEIIAAARFAMLHVPISLGCARERGNREIECMAIDAGVNRMAIPSDEAVEHALGYGLEIRYQPTCCSVSLNISEMANSLLSTF